MLGLWSTALVLVTAAISLMAPARAELQGPECTQTNLASTEEKTAPMKDSWQNATAAAEIATARDMLSNGRIEDCRTALLKATLQTK